MTCSMEIICSISIYHALTACLVVWQAQEHTVVPCPHGACFLMGKADSKLINTYDFHIVLGALAKVKHSDERRVSMGKNVLARRI